jgi:hypothetical protein
LTGRTTENVDTRDAWSCVRIVLGLSTSNGDPKMHGSLAAAARRSSEIRGQARGCSQRAHDTPREPVRCIRRRALDTNISVAAPHLSTNMCKRGRGKTGLRRLFAPAASSQGHLQPCATIGAEPMAGCRNGSLGTWTPEVGGARFSLPVTCPTARCLERPKQGVKLFAMCTM